MEANEMWSEWDVYHIIFLVHRNISKLYVWEWDIFCAKSLVGRDYLQHCMNGNGTLQILSWKRYSMHDANRNGIYNKSQFGEHD